MKIAISKMLGCFNLLDPKEQMWNLRLSVEGIGYVNITLAEDDEPDIDGAAPSEVAVLMIERINKFWLYTNRDRDVGVCNAIIARAEEIDARWAVQQAAAYRTQAAQLIKRADALIDAYPMPEGVQS